MIMKKIVAVLLLIGILFYPNANSIEKTILEEDRGVFISYIELNKYLKNIYIDNAEKNIDK